MIFALGDGQGSCGCIGGSEVGGNVVGGGVCDGGNEEANELGKNLGPD